MTPLVSETTSHPDVGSFISDTGDDTTNQIIWRAKTNEF